MTAGAAAVIWRGCRRGWGAGGERGRRPISACRERPSPGNLDVAKGAHDLDLEVREGGDDLPFAAAAGEGAHALDADVLEGVHDLDLDVGKGVDDLDLAAQRMPCRCNWPCRGRGPAPGRARRAGRGRGGSAFFSWGRDGSARPSALQAQPARQLVQVAGVHLQHAGGRGVAVVRLQRQPDVLALAGVHGVARQAARRPASWRAARPAGARGRRSAPDRSSRLASSVTMWLRLAPRLTALMAARLMTCSSSRTLPGQR